MSDSLENFFLGALVLGLLVFLLSCSYAIVKSINHSIEKESCLLEERGDD